MLGHYQAILRYGYAAFPKIECKRQIAHKIENSFTGMRYNGINVNETYHAEHVRMAWIARLLQKSKICLRAASVVMLLFFAAPF